MQVEFTVILMDDERLSIITVQEIRCLSERFVVC
jgi:hypothetical protein